MAMRRPFGRLQKFFLHVKEFYGSLHGPVVFSGLILSKLPFHMFLQEVLFMLFMKMFQDHYGLVPMERDLFKLTEVKKL